ncbi:unnamed protein product [Chondrus crispus]|uniref:Uncharacterized protein n=1 Tax=Chondrus crispus TaxID=2769 RepID=R7QIQ2_CHOCR|nr:unnamed protein product [Chondrus crispus]CDF37949.1 unnamed protein product [Chondrus crispus]|eukprot:XP_005717818.1 unnamed protein product [Chondrus crispus]
MIPAPRARIHGERFHSQWTRDAYQSTVREHPCVACHLSVDFKAQSHSACPSFSEQARVFCVKLGRETLGPEECYDVVSGFCLDQFADLLDQFNATQDMSDRPVLEPYDLHKLKIERPDRDGSGHCLECSSSPVRAFPRWDRNETSIPRQDHYCQRSGCHQCQNRAEAKHCDISLCGFAFKLRQLTTIKRGSIPRLRHDTRTTLTDLEPRLVVFH